MDPYIQTAEDDDPATQNVQLPISPPSLQSHLHKVKKGVSYPSRQDHDPSNRGLPLSSSKLAISQDDLHPKTFGHPPLDSSTMSLERQMRELTLLSNGELGMRGPGMWRRGGRSAGFGVRRLVCGAWRRRRRRGDRGER